MNQNKQTVFEILVLNFKNVKDINVHIHSSIFKGRQLFQRLKQNY